MRIGGMVLRPLSKQYFVFSSSKKMKIQQVH